MEQAHNGVRSLSTALVAGAALLAGCSGLSTDLQGEQGVPPSSMENDPAFHARMKPQGVWADLTRTRFHRACTRLGLGRAWANLDCTQFRPPERDGQIQLL